MERGNHGASTNEGCRQAIRDAIFSCARHLMIATDAVGNIVDMNPAAERLLGYARDELVGQATPLVFHDPDELAAEAVRLSRELNTDIPPGFEVFVARPRRDLPYEREWTCIRKDGSRFVTLMDIGPLRDPAGALIGFCGISLDVTDRKESERAALAVQAADMARKEAERANLAKSKFLAAASHDLRQPLQSALLFAAALSSIVQGEAGQRLIGNLDKSLEGLRVLLDRLLDISKLDAGAVQVQAADFALGTLLEELNTIYTPRAEGKGLGWRVTPCPPTVMVHSDPDLLCRILRNLIENALIYTLEGSVELSCEVGDDRVRVTVSDSGIGIPEDKLDEVFQEFTQLGNPERDRNQGLGLGLAIVRRLSRLVDHPVEVRSTYGVGSAFSVTVPLATGAGPVAEPEAVTHCAAGGGRLVLIVEDDALVRAGLVAMIQSWGYDTLDAGSWEEADTALRASPRAPEGIIIDYRLRNGITGLSVLRAMRDLYEVPARSILLTGETGADPVEEAKEFGCTLLHKPVSPGRLRAALADLLHSAD